MPAGSHLQLLGLAVAAFVGGLFLFARGLLAWRAGTRLGDVPGSPIGTAPAGEVRLSGTIEPDLAALTSPLQGLPCVYYRATVERGMGRQRQRVYHAERAVSFWLVDDSGRVRLLPRGARWEVPPVFDDSGLPDAAAPEVTAAASGGLGELGGGLGALLGGGPLHCREATLEAGMTVTVLGGLLPYRDVADPLVASTFEPAAAGPDPEVAADLAAARAAGRLAPSPEAAWGDAAIPGLDIDPDALVVARPAAPGGSLTIYAGPPSLALAEQRWTFGVGIVGAVLAAAALLVIALVLGGRL